MKHSASLVVLVVLLSLALVPPGLARQETPACETPELQVVATIGMIADVVRNIAGTCVDVIQLMGSGVDPHLYRASEGDVLTLLDANVVFYGGLDLEARLAEVFERMGDYKPTVAVGEAIPEEKLLRDPVYNLPDPHVWMDVELWMHATERIRDALIELDPAHETLYQENTDAYLEELKALDDYVHEQIERVPRRQRVLVTAHDAFAYFGRAYDIEVFAPQGITTTSEAGVEDIRKTIQIIVERNVPAVFIESSVPPDIVEAIVEGAAAQGQEVRIGGQLFSDAM